VIAAAEVLTGGLDAREQAAVFGRTAALWYRIEV
jgi:hypothetical protein